MDKTSFSLPIPCFPATWLLFPETNGVLFVHPYISCYSSSDSLYIYHALRHFPCRHWGAMNTFGAQTVL